MTILKRSFIYYALFLIIINTIDFKQVHLQRLGWFVFLLSQGDAVNKMNTNAQLYDYLGHLQSNVQS
jgi:hypothetical protein